LVPSALDLPPLFLPLAFFETDSGPHPARAVVIRRWGCLYTTQNQIGSYPFRRVNISTTHLYQTYRPWTNFHLDRAVGQTCTSDTEPFAPCDTARRSNQQLTVKGGSLRTKGGPDPTFLRASSHTSLGEKRSSRTSRDSQRRARLICSQVRLFEHANPVPGYHPGIYVYQSPCPALSVFGDFNTGCHLQLVVINGLNLKMMGPTSRL
jgi:hypothetical protein